MANRNWTSSKLYNMYGATTLVSCTFTVDSTSPTGVTNLKGPAIQEVLMHSVAATPSTLNPSIGYVVVKLTDNYNGVIAVMQDTISPIASGSQAIDDSLLSVGMPYIITVVGNAPLSQWRLVGLPEGTTPAIGVSFIAISAGPGGDTFSSRVGQLDTSNLIDSVFLVGDPNAGISESSQHGASFIFALTRDSSPVAVDDGTIITLSFLLNNSSVNA